MTDLHKPMMHLTVCYLHYYYYYYYHHCIGQYEHFVTQASSIIYLSVLFGIGRQVVICSNLQFLFITKFLQP